MWEAMMAIIEQQLITAAEEDEVTLADIILVLAEDEELTVA